MFGNMFGNIGKKIMNYVNTDGRKYVRKKCGNFLKMMLVFGIIECFALNGCGKEAPLDMEQILKNEMVIEYFETQGWTIVNAETEKRQTNEEEKTDYLYCQITVENGSMRKIGQYKISSEYYEEGGWIIDEIMEDSYYFEPIADPVLEDVIGEKGGYYNVEIAWPLEEYPDEFRAEIKYQNIHKHTNFDVEEDYVLEAYFDINDGIWKEAERERLNRRYTNFNFGGKYAHYRHSKQDLECGNYTIVISNLDEKTMSATIEVEGIIEKLFPSDALEEVDVKQHGDTNVVGYDKRNLPDEIIEKLNKIFVAGYWKEADEIKEMIMGTYDEDGILFVLQCSGLSSYEEYKEEIYDVFLDVYPEECYLGIKKTDNSTNSYRWWQLEEE